MTIRTRPTATLRTFLDDRMREREDIPPARLQVLRELADRVREREGTARVMFVCTHNARRSHLAQVWMHAACAGAGVREIECFSAGAEVTRVHPAVLAALSHAGLRVREITGGANPVVEVSGSLSRDEPRDIPPLRLFSKQIDDPSNPRDGFIVVTVCSDADAACPVVRGAAARVHLPYEDPKIADGTPRELDTYGDRSAQIAREMCAFATMLTTGAD